MKVLQRNESYDINSTYYNQHYNPVAVIETLPPIAVLIHNPSVHKATCSKLYNTVLINPEQLNALSAQNFAKLIACFANCPLYKTNIEQWGSKDIINNVIQKAISTLKHFSQDIKSCSTKFYGQFHYIFKQKQKLAHNMRLLPFYDEQFVKLFILELKVYYEQVASITKYYTTNIKNNLIHSLNTIAKFQIYGDATSKSKQLASNIYKYLLHPQHYEKHINLGNAVMLGDAAKSLAINDVELLCRCVNIIVKAQDSFLAPTQQRFIIKKALYFNSYLSSLTTNRFLDNNIQQLLAAFYRITHTAKERRRMITLANQQYFYCEPDYLIAKLPASSELIKTPDQHRLICHNLYHSVILNPTKLNNLSAVNFTKVITSFAFCPVYQRKHRTLLGFEQWGTEHINYLTVINRIIYKGMQLMCSSPQYLNINSYDFHCNFYTKLRIACSFALLAFRSLEFVALFLNELACYYQKIAPAIHYRATDIKNNLTFGLEAIAKFKVHHNNDKIAPLSQEIYKYLLQQQHYNMIKLRVKDAILLGYAAIDLGVTQLDLLMQLATVVVKFGSYSLEKNYSVAFVTKATYFHDYIRLIANNNLSSQHQAILSQFNDIIPSRTRAQQLVKQRSKTSALKQAVIKFLKQLVHTIGTTYNIDIELIPEYCHHQLRLTSYDFALKININNQCSTVLGDINGPRHRDFLNNKIPQIAKHLVATQSDYHDPHVFMELAMQWSPQQWQVMQAIFNNQRSLQLPLTDEQKTDILQLLMQKITELATKHQGSTQQQTLNTVTGELSAILHLMTGSNLDNNLIFTTILQTPYPCEKVAANVVFIELYPKITIIDVTELIAHIEKYNSFVTNKLDMRNLKILHQLLKLLSNQHQQNVLLKM